MIEIFHKDEVLQFQLYLTICTGLSMAMGMFKREVKFANTQMSLFSLLVSWGFTDIFGFYNGQKSGLYSNDTELNLPPQNNAHAWAQSRLKELNFDIKTC